MQWAAASIQEALHAPSIIGAEVKAFLQRSEGLALIRVSTTMPTRRLDGLKARKQYGPVAHGAA